MKGSTRKRKTTGLPPKKSDFQIPLPGSAGIAVLEKLNEGNVDEAMEIFYREFIGNLNERVSIQILEDDGKSMMFVGNRGVFRVHGLGRQLLLMVLQAPKQEAPAEPTE